MVPSSRSTTRAATAASSASGETPARFSRDSVGVPTAAASASALRVAAGNAEILSRQELFDRVGDRERRERVDLLGEYSRQLQRKERIPARPLVDPKQRLARERPLHPVAQQPVQRPRAEWSHGHASDPVRTECSFELRPRCRLSAPPCEEKTDRSRAQPPDGERERMRGRRVEPLSIVNRDQRRPTLAQQLQRVAHRDRKRAPIDGLAGRLLPEQRDFQRAPSRRQQLRQHLVDDTVEEIR